MPVVTALLLDNRTMDRGTDCSVVSPEEGEMADMPAVTAVRFLHRAMDTGTDCGVVCTGVRGICGYACSYRSTVTSQSYGYSD